MKNWVALILSLVIGMAEAQELPAPVGVRPCCAFGMDLKAQLGSVPVPFFSLGNVLSSNEIGSHHYNDGSESVSGSLLGFNDEVNGLVFTELGGFIDIAHVRDTADYTYYLFRLNQIRLGKNAQLELPEELRIRRIVWHQQPNEMLWQDHVNRSAEAAALIAFRLAQWHEIAQWFGLVSVSGFKEYASAFSSEDLYSNMLGAILAKDILLHKPNVSEHQFEQEMDRKLSEALVELKVQSKSVAREKMAQLDGIWWDSKRRLPDKWVVLFRDYHLALRLTPNYSGATRQLQLKAQFADQQPIEEWVSLELIASDHEKAFEMLPKQLKVMPRWQVSQFQALADHAKQSDDMTAPK